MRLVAEEMNLALYRLPSVHRSSTSSPSGGGPSRKQSLLCREGTVRPHLACPSHPGPLCPAPHRDAFWVHVVAVGAIIEVDLVEGLGGGAYDTAAIIQPIAILGDDNLAQRHSPQELTLGTERWRVSVGFCWVGEAGWGPVGWALAEALTPAPPALCLRQVMDTT